MINDRSDVLHDLRHQVYRQYGFMHIRAIQEGVPDSRWLRFDDSKLSRVPLGIPLCKTTVISADRYIWETYGPHLKCGVEMVLIESSGRNEIIQ